jgi:putative membrane protein
MKTPKIILSLAATAAMLVCTTLTQALDHSDRAFFEKAAKASQNEVTISQEALAHLTSPSARDFANMVIADHGKLNAELSSLAATKGVTLPPPSERVAKKWANNTKDVDDEYLATMVSEHKDAVDLFEKAAKSKDADIAAFAQRALPTLREHLSMAKTDKKLN